LDCNLFVIGKSAFWDIDPTVDCYNRSPIWSGGTRLEVSFINTDRALLRAVGKVVISLYTVAEPSVAENGEICGGANAGEHVQAPIAGLDQDVVDSLCTGRREPASLNDFGNMEELDDAAASFSLAPQQAKNIGCWSYVSTRNNNFSNRSQKGTICVDKGDFQSGTAGPNGAAVIAINSWVNVPKGTLTNNEEITIQSAPKKGMASEEVWIEPVYFTAL
jgi:hypothetical protein